MQWYLKALRQYADFEGRARRTEFWMFFLFNALVAIVLGIIAGALYNATNGASIWLVWIYQLAVLIPYIAVAVRRLHDTGRTGWWYLIALVPLVGLIILIVFWATAGNPGPNQYGPDPKAGAMGAPNYGYPAA